MTFKKQPHCFISRVIHGIVLAISLIAATAPNASSQTPVATAESSQTPLTTGRLAGRVLDAASGVGVEGAQISIVGGVQTGQSARDGKYNIGRVPTGQIAILVRRLGYRPKTITGLNVPAGGVALQDILLESTEVVLTAVKVSVAKEQGTVAEALNQQQRSASLINAITREELTRSPDGDAAQAAQRVSGVTVQDGKYLQVRGLGERYTTASLNGTRLPSPEPERKMVPFDLFPAGLLQDITTVKTFTPDLPGDFAGANVNIRTREFPAGRQATYSTAFGANTRVLGHTLPFAPRAGGELLGISGDARRIPSAIANANFLSGVSQWEYNDMARKQRNVWQAAPRAGGGSGSLAASVGGNSILGHRIGYLLSGNYQYAEEARASEHFAVGNQGPNNSVVPLSQYNGETGRASIQWGGIASISMIVRRNSRIAINATATRSADNEARTDRGLDENLADSVVRTTLRYVERGVVSANIQAEHQLGSRNRTSWSISSAMTNRKEPDRSDIVYSRSADGTYSLLASLDGARRLYFDLQETNKSAQIDHSISFDSEGSQNALRFGANYRTTHRNADAPIFAFLSRADGHTRSLSPEQVFGPTQSCSECNQINVQPVGQAGSYSASDQTAAAYMMLDVSLSARTRLISGARVEKASIEVLSSTQGGFSSTAALGNVDLLPSAIITERLTDNQNIRFAVTRTLARPEYRELSPITFRDVLGGVSVTGNDRLQRSLINNVDVRWETFPSPGEVLSVGVFAKHFERPIERLESATSGAYQARFQNALGATNIGVELEARKSLSFLGEWAAPLTASGNITLMRSTVSLDTLQGINVTDRRRSLVGQAPYVLNGSIAYSNASGRIGVNLLYNVVGKRIHAAGVLPLPNIIEMPRHNLDLSLRFPLAAQISARLDMRNLIDSRYRLMQGTLEREGYNAGRTVTIGLSWNH